MNTQKNMLCTCTGKGCVFTYDAVGSYERTGYSAQGTGSTLMMPVLDNQLKSPSPLLLPARVSLSHSSVCFLLSIFLVNVPMMIERQMNVAICKYLIIRISSTKWNSSEGGESRDEDGNRSKVKQQNKCETYSGRNYTDMKQITRPGQRYCIRRSDDQRYPDWFHATNEG